MAEEELNYVAVKFNSEHLPNDNVIYEDVRNELEIWPPKHHTQEKCSDIEEIYDDVRSKELPCSLPHILQENVSKLSLHTPVNLAAAALGVLCVILLSAIIALTLHLNGIMGEQRRQNINLTAHNEQMQAEMEQLRERARELSMERDRLNWTVGQIFQYDTFPVVDHCPQKVLNLCKPCPNDWLQFGSKCYLILHFLFSLDWKTWQGSLEYCNQRNAHLLIIESQEEQEFVTNYTKYYNDNKHGYWMGLTKNILSNKWRWNDGSNLTLAFWREEIQYDKSSCSLLSKSLMSKSLDNWSKASCTMKNRFICQTHAFTQLNTSLPYK